MLKRRKRPEPKAFDVLSTSQITPNMRRVTLGGAAMNGFPTDKNGGYLKFQIPNPNSERPYVRTYTIRHQYEDRLDVDFALHGEDGEGGPAVKWSLKTKVGDQIKLSGPGAPKPLPSGMDWYLLAGDMTALPAISVNIEALPKDARGHAVIEIQSEADKQEIEHPKGMKIHWVINPNPGHDAKGFDDYVRSIEWEDGEAYAWVATEFETMKRLRTYLRTERELDKFHLYISSYWKYGLIEDQHKVVKRQDAEASQ